MTKLKFTYRKLNEIRINDFQFEFSNYEELVRKRMTHMLSSGNSEELSMIYNLIMKTLKDSNLQENDVPFTVIIDTLIKELGDNKPSLWAGLLDDCYSLTFHGSNGYTIENSEVYPNEISIHLSNTFLNCVVFDSLEERRSYECYTELYSMLWRIILREELDFHGNLLNVIKSDMFDNINKY